MFGPLWCVWPTTSRLVTPYTLRKLALLSNTLLHSFHFTSTPRPMTSLPSLHSTPNFHPLLFHFQVYIIPRLYSRCFVKPLYHLLSNDKFIYYINKDSYRVLASYNYLFTYHENATHEAYFRQINEREKIRERRILIYYIQH